MMGQQISPAKSRSTPSLECQFVYTSLKFYGIFTRSWMVPCMLFMKKCSLWSSCIEYKRNVVWRTWGEEEQNEKIWQYEFFAWSKLIILKYKIIILNHRHEHRQDFNVYIKQYNTETGCLRLTLDSTRRESERKAIKFFSQEKKLRATSSKPE